MTLEFNSNVASGCTPVPSAGFVVHHHRASDGLVAPPVVGWRIFGDKAVPAAPHPKTFINMNSGTALRTVEEVIERERAAAAAGADTGGNK